MTELDAKWKKTLSQWRDIEPRPGFEGRVWRRIHTAEPSPAAQMADAMRGWFAVQAAWAHAAALVVGAALGLAVTATSLHPADSHAAHDMNIVRTGSVAGSYLQLVGGQGDR